MQIAMGGERNHAACTQMARGRLLAALVVTFALFLALPLSAFAGTLTASPPSSNFNPQPYYFGGQFNNFHIDNSGGSGTTISAVNITGTDAGQFSISGTSCSGTIPDGGGCDIGVNFNPPNHPGTFNAQLEVSSDDPASPLIIPLSAQVLAGPSLVPSPSDVDFGATTLGTVSTRQVTMTNAGDFPGQIQQAFVLGPAVFSIGDDTCTQQILNPGQSCTLNALFAPAATREYQGSIFVIIGNSVKPVLPINLSGEGQPTSGPLTEITRKPKKKTRSTTASFTFSSPTSGLIFECSLDGEPFQTCASPATYVLHRGRHQFQARVKQGTNSVGPATSYSWQILKKKKKKRH